MEDFIDGFVEVQHKKNSLLYYFMKFSAWKKLRNSK
jgi:hypothetical protein